MLAFYPLPNGPVLGDTGLFVFANETLSDQNYITNRLDAGAGARGKIFFRCTYDGGTQQSETDFASGLQRDTTRHSSAVLEEMHVLSPRLLHTARLGVVRTRAQVGATTTLIPGADSPELEFVPGRGVLGDIVVTGLTTFPAVSGASPSDRGLLPLNGSPRFNRGLSGHDVRHYFTGSGAWTLPSLKAGRLRPFLSGWRLGAIVIHASGLPDSVYLAYDAARTKTHATGAAISQRPDLAPGAPRNPVTGDPQRWVDPSAFARPQPGYLGDLGRNTLIGPNLANVDLSLAKRFPLPRWTDAAGLELRLEAFNVFNRANFDLPVVNRMAVFTETATPEDFARITSADPSREIQVGLKLRF